jgi:hypothetical protein
MIRSNNRKEIFGEILNKNVAVECLEHPEKYHKQLSLYWREKMTAQFIYFGTIIAITIAVAIYIAIVVAIQHRIKLEEKGSQGMGKN